MWFHPPQGTADGSTPYRYLYPPPPGEGHTNYTNVKQRLHIENVRGKEYKFTLDGAGFQFLRQPLTFKGFEKADVSEEEVRQGYYSEVIEMVKKVTGASEVIIYDHKIRRHIPGKSRFEDPVKRGVVPIVHADETPISSVTHVHRNISEEEASSLLKRRFQLINIWRPISHPAWDHPLALCDYRSVDMDKDLVLVDLKVSEEITDETYEINFNPKQEWKYLRGMRTDEVVLFKCHDSIQDGSVATLVPHAAFTDPSTPPGSPFRESIEVRSLVFYD
ncbi:hypothetical protein L218DRAFT_864088 [Marasmius fiardii PR-910]|nr:hypothetical protein L218DRAFT_864088 [Marasmius fiardii PR-910]